MSFFVAAPDALAAAASDIAGIGSTISAANTAAALPTAGLMAPAADAVSAQVAQLFSTHAAVYGQISSQMSAFHDQFVGALQGTANSYAAAEASAAQSLAGAISAPTAKLMGQPLIGQGGGSAAGALTNALGRIESLFPGTGGSNALGGKAATLGAGLGALRLPGTGAINAVKAAAASPAAGILPVGIGDAIENFYLGVEPYVEYGFDLVAYAAGFVPYVGLLAPQIYIFYDLFEPIVQSALFNTVDWLDGTISFAQGLTNLGSATTASINQFITNEINWALGYLPPLPPLPPG
jgi:PE family